MKSSIPLEKLRALYENDNLPSLYNCILNIYQENTNGNELTESLKEEIRYTLLYAPDFDTILERLDGLVQTYQQYFHA